MPPRWGSTWSAENVARLHELIATGKSASIIAGELGITKNSVIGKCHRLGISTGVPSIRKAPGTVASKWSPEILARLHELVAAGNSAAIIADELGFSRHAIIGKCNRLGITTRDPAYNPTRRPARQREHRRANYAGSPKDYGAAYRDEDLSIHRHFGGPNRPYIVPSRRKQEAARAHAKASAAEDRAMIDAAIAEGRVTKCPPGHAFGWDGDAMVDRIAR